MTTIDHLPAELLVLFFVILSFRDRVRASHVSRRWRAVATEHSVLWTRLKFHHKPKHRAAFLSALSRAGDLPVEAVWKFTNPPSQGFDDLEANILRVRVIRVDCCWTHADTTLLERLLARPLRLLEELRIQCAEPFTIPPQWSHGDAPRLRVIAVSKFLFHPTTGRFHTLRYLSGAMSDNTHNTLYFPSIFELCPALVELELYGVSRQLVHYLSQGSPPPSTLVSLKLLPPPKDTHTLFRPIRDTIDYHTLFETLGRMPSLLAITLAADFCAAIKHYVTHVHTPFRMECNIRYSPGSLDPGPFFEALLDNGGSHTLTCNMTDLRAALAITSNLLPYLHNLTQLECSASFFDCLLHLDPSLPSLHTLILIVSGNRPHGDLNYYHFQRRGQLIAPRLRSLVVDATVARPFLVSGASYWFSRRLPASATMWLKFEEPKLETAYFYMHRGVRTAPAISPEAFLSWVERVFIGWRVDQEKALELGIWYTGQGTVPAQAIM
ncbi:hypothetical protein AURDEDRAFT_136815 [Auricularia subglabra TFB-10046 SS5]|nr:hypothetical protein AURDEDRAFT_136815 [Auricularia subglabra TFB-10046 SS5]